MDLSLEIILGAVALATGLWEQVRSILGWFAGFVLAQRRCDQSTAGLLVSYFTRGGKSPSTRVPAYRSMFHFFIKPLGKTGRVLYEERLESGSMVLWHRRRPMWFAKQREDAPDGLEYVFSYVRGTFDWEATLVAALRWSLESKSSAKGKVRNCVVRHYGRRLATFKDEDDTPSRSGPDHYSTWSFTAGDRIIGWSEDDISGAPRTSSFDNLAVMPNLQEMYDEFKFFMESESWYKSHKLAWKHGWSLEGAPGTGKTTFIREVAAEFDLPIHVMDLASMSNEDLQSAWAKALADTPCIVLTEDIDAVFDGRDNITPGGGMMASGGLTFDCLLNCIDGVERNDGIIYFLTTNNPEVLDDALLRPGRVDGRVTFEPLDYLRRVKVALTILGEENRAEAEALAASVEDMPAAKFSELCTRAALAKLYAQREADRRNTDRDIPRMELVKEVE